MKYFSVIILVLVLFSCMEEKKTDTVSEEIKPSTSDSLKGKDSISEKDSIIIDTRLSFEEKAEKLKEKYGNEFSGVESDKTIVPERFESKWKMKFFCSKPEMEFYFFEYSDTTLKQNVINNWYNCFGSDCISIKENENIKGLKSGSSFSVINETEIIYFKYDCKENEKTTTAIISELKMLFGNKKSLYPGIYCNGILKWK